MRCLLVCLLFIGIACSKSNRSPLVRHIEGELRTAVLQMSSDFISRASAPSASGFARRAICEVTADSIRSVIGASPLLFLPQAQVNLKLMDRDYQNTLQDIFRKFHVRPSAPGSVQHSEQQYWEAFMRCQQTPTVYPNQSDRVIENLDEVSSYYFCFHAKGKDFTDYQPIIIEARYTPYNVDNTELLERDSAIPCRDYHDPRNATKRLERLQYSIYWTSLDGTTRRFHQVSRTYLTSDR